MPCSAQLVLISAIIAMETAAATPEVQSQVLAKKLRRGLKNPQWSTPSKVPLFPSKETVIGRCPATASVMMHSPKLPSMLSRRHAAITYEASSKQWFIEDLGGINGIYINNIKLASKTRAPVKLGDEICFGVNIDTNDFKYVLTSHKGRPVLKCIGRVSDPDSQESQGSQTPPNPPESPIPRKKPRTEVQTNSQQSQDTIHPSHNSTPEKPPIANSSPATSTTTTAISQLSVEDAIFPDDLLENHTDSVSDALFGDGKPEPSLEKLGTDATTIQIQMAKQEMDKEKHKLLSNIKALKSELAAKEQILVGQQEKTTANDSMLSSMQEEFTCVICQELFVNAYTLPCAHSFCEWCIKQWMTGKGHRDCPICRKTITSVPVHSLVLDNAIYKVVQKLGADAQRDREILKKEHIENLNKLEHPVKEASSVPAVRVIRRDPVVVIDPVPSRPEVILVPGSDESSSSSSEEESDESGSYDSSESSNEGIPGAYFGGYGYCFNCGRRGHWVRGCPYR